MFVKAVETGNIPKGSVIAVQHRGETIAVANVDGQFYAFSSGCTHAAAWLHEGLLEGCIINCPAHWGAYDVRTGEAVELPAFVPVQTYPVRIIDGNLEIDLPG